MNHLTVDFQFALQTLKPTIWLSGALIEFYFDLVRKGLVEIGSQLQIRCMQTIYSIWFVRQSEKDIFNIENTDAEKERELLTGTDLLFVPLNTNGHWILVILDFRKKEVRVFNSLKSNHVELAGRVYKYFRRQYFNLFGAKLEMSFHHERAPQQPNGFDCGVYVCQFMKYLSLGVPFNFNMLDMSVFRTEMVTELKENKLRSCPTDEQIRTIYSN